MDIFSVNETDTRGLNHSLDILQKFLTFLGQRTIDLGPVKVMIRPERTGYRVEAAAGLLEFRSDESSMELRLGTSVHITAEKNSGLKVYMRDSAEISGLDVKCKINTFTASLAELKAEIAGGVNISTGNTLAVTAADMLLKGTGSVLLSGADINLHAGNGLLVKGKAAMTSVTERIILNSITGTVNMFGLKGVRISTVNPDIKAKTGTVTLESNMVEAVADFIALGKGGMVPVGKAPETVQALTTIYAALSALGGALSGFKIEAVGGAAAGSALTAALAPLSAQIQGIPAKRVVVE